MIFDLRKDIPNMIKVIGVGGAGGNAVNHMFRSSIPGVDFAICNTDLQALNSSEVPTKIQLGAIIAGGLGAGNTPEIARQACNESIDDIKLYLDSNCKMLFITAGMGGGTGTGAAPVIAELAKNMGILTIAVVTMPNEFEGPKRVRQGNVGLEELKNNVDSIIVISNAKIMDFYGNLSFTGAFAKADDVLMNAAKAISEIITRPGIINVDFNDVEVTMKGSGSAIMGLGISEGENRSLLATEEALNSHLLEDNSVAGASKVLINVTYGTIEPTFKEIEEITKYVRAETGAAADLIWGACYDEELEDRLSVTIIATAFDK
jgi:cell division protein FtsZ